MRVLFLVTYITITGEETFTKNITGYGHMVRDIADYVSQNGVDVDVITFSAMTKGKKYEKFSLLRRTWYELFKNFKPYYIREAIRMVIKYKPSLKRATKVLYYYFSAGYVEHIIRTGKYDMIHIHGIGFHTQAYMDCCERIRVKYLVTLHGLISFSDSVRCEAGEKMLEKDFLKRAKDRSLPLTVISTGILNTISKYLEEKDIRQFFVVPNGTDIHPNLEVNSLSIREEYSIANHKKIMLCVGNLCNRKNQIQVVRAYALLPEKIKEQICILFLGNDMTEGEVGRKIAELNLENHLIQCGNIKREDIRAFYKQADYTILASISEGFGLSIIEGFVYGLPSLTFSDLDAIEDIYDPKAMVILDERADEVLADGMVRIMSTEWDREYIQEGAKKFSLEKMAKEYIKVYNIVNPNSSL